MRKALLIGINYYGSPCQLNGCINDAHNMKAALESYGYTQFRVLTDMPGTSPGDLPTRNNILTAFNWLVQDAAAGDKLFLHYSGHGTQSMDRNGDEADRQDEALCPLDYSSGLILDDTLNSMVVQRVPSGCQLIFVSDCCHSGTIMDLRFNYKQAAQYEVSMTQDPKQKSLGSTVVCLSGCLDHQTSMDTVAPNPVTGQEQNQGALSWVVLEILKEQPNVSFRKLLKELWIRLRSRGYAQIPQLSCSRYLDLSTQVQL